MYLDINGYLSDNQANYILAGVLLASLLAVSAAGPIGVLAIVSGMASGAGQILSNAVNDQPLDKNVVGAIVGGVLTIALGPAGIVIGAAANAGLNAFENKNIYNEDISIESILFQFASYSVSNLMARNMKVIDPLYSFLGFTAIDSGIYAFTDWAEEYVIDFIRYVRDVER